MNSDATRRELECTCQALVSCLSSAAVVLGEGNGGPGHRLRPLCVELAPHTIDCSCSKPTRTSDSNSLQAECVTLERGMAVKMHKACGHWLCVDFDTVSLCERCGRRAGEFKCAAPLHVTALCLVLRREIICAKDNISMQRATTCT